MLLLFVVLILIGLALTLDSDKDWKKAVGVFFIAIAILFPLPKMWQNSVRYVKEKGIEDYLKGRVEVIITEEQIFYLWP